MELIGYHSTNTKQYRKIITNGFNPIQYADKNKYKNKKQSIRTWFTREPQFCYGNICMKVNLTELNCKVDDHLIICKEPLILPNRIIGKIDFYYLKKINVFDRYIIRTLF